MFNLKKLMGLILLCGSQLALANPGESIQELNFAHFLHEMIYAIAMLGDRVINASMRLLYFCALIMFLLTALRAIINKDGTVNDWVLIIIRYIIFIGIFQIIILNGYAISSDIINSFISISIPQVADGSVNPDHIVTYVLQLLSEFFNLCEAYFDMVSQEHAFFAVIFMAIMFSTIVCAIIIFSINYIAAISISLIGIIIIPLGIVKILRPIAARFFYLTCGMGLRMLIICFLIQSFQNYVSQIIYHLAYLVDKGYIVSLQDAGITLLIMLFMLFTLIILPPYISRLTKF